MQGSNEFKSEYWTALKACNNDVVTACQQLRYRYPWIPSRTVMEKDTHKIKPLGRKIALGCIIFIITLCVVLGVGSHLNYKYALYERYKSYIIDILHYVDTTIDAED